MSDYRISDLNLLPEADLAADDDLVVVDDSASETKRIKAKALIEKGVSLIDAGSIPGSAIATLGANTVVTASIADASVTNAKLQNYGFDLGGLSIALGSTDNTPAFDLSDATNYPASSLTGTISNAQLTGSIANNKLANSSISLGGVSIDLGGTIATPTFNLTNATNYPASSLTGTITNAQLAGSIANTKLVNSSISLGGVNISLGGSDSSPSFDLSDATNYPASSLTGTVSNAQLAGNIQGSKILSGSISSTELGTNSVTAVELANLSVDTAALIDSSVTDAKISAVSGTKISAGSLPATALNTSNLGTGLAVSNNNLVIDNTVAAGTATKVTFSSEGLITSSASLAASDLPIADATNVGGVSIGGGLAITGAGALSLSNSITAATVSGIQFNAFGQIVSATNLVSSDLPISNSSQVGGVKITVGGGLSVDGSGGLSTSSTGISGGTYTKLTINAKGVATAGDVLASSDIPALDASKITTGSLDAGRIGVDTIDGSKLSDSSTTIFQSIAQSGFPSSGQFKGQLLFDTVDEDAYIYDGTGWQAITTLTKGSLVFGGTYDAKNAEMIRCTAAGISAGLSNGSNLPTASGTTDGIYVVVAEPTEAGTNNGVGVSPAPTVALAPPDYIIGVTTSANASEWLEVDLSATMASQTASNITFSNTGSGIDGVIAGTVQDAIEELATEKLAKAGGTISGQLLIGHTGSVVFEGSSNDDYELTLAVADPQSSDKTLTLPDRNGTLITSGDENTVTSTMVDGSLTQANLASNAAIAFSQLANLPSASIIVGNGSNVPTEVTVTGDISITNAGVTAIGAGKITDAMVSSTAAISGSKVTAASTSASGTVQLNDSTNSTSTSEAATANAVKAAKDAADSAATTANAALPKAGGSMTGDILLDNYREIRFYEATTNGSAYVGINGAIDKGDSASYTISLPAAGPAAGEILTANASTPTTLEWAAPTDSTKMPLSGGTFTGDLIINDNITAGFGSDNDLRVWHDGNHAYLNNHTGNFYIRNKGDNDDSDIHIQARNEEESIVCLDDGPVELYHNGDVRLKTWEDGVIIRGDEDEDSILYLHADKGEDNADLWLLKADNVASGFYIQNYNSGSWEDSIKCFGDGAVEIFNDGVKTLSTETNGITVFGAENGDAALHLYSDEGDDDADKIRIRKPAVNNVLIIEGHTSGENAAWEDMGRFNIGGGVELHNAGNKRFETTSTGAKVTGSALIEQSETTGGGNYNLALKNTHAGNDYSLIYFQSTDSDSTTSTSASIQSKFVGTGSTNGKFEIQTRNAGTLTTALTLNETQNATFAGTVSDSSGNLRSIPNNNQSSAYTVVAADAGKCITSDTDVTIDSSVLSVGDAVSFINKGSSAISIVQGSGLTLYNTADAATGSRSLASRGMATIWVASSTVAYISGAGLS